MKNLFFILVIVGLNFSLLAKDFEWAEGVEDRVSPIAIPYSCGNEIKVLTGFAAAYRTDSGDEVDFFPMGVEDYNNASGPGDLSTDKEAGYPSISAGQKGDKLPAELDKFITSSLQGLAPLEPQHLIAEGNQETLARLLAKANNYNYDELSERAKKHLLDIMDKNVKKDEGITGFDFEQEVECGEGNKFAIKLRIMSPKGAILKEGGGLKDLNKSVACLPEDATSDASCLKAYRKAMQDLKNSGKPMFAFSGPSNNQDLADSNLTRHAGPVSSSTERSSSQTGRGIKQAGSGLGQSHKRRN